MGSEFSRFVRELFWAFALVAMLMASAGCAPATPSTPDALEVVESQGAYGIWSYRRVRTPGGKIYDCFIALDGMDCEPL